MHFKSVLIFTLSTGILAAPTLTIDASTQALLKEITQDIQRLLVALGLGSLAPGLGGSLSATGQISKRDAAAAPAPALLADLSPDAQSILAAIGLGSLSPGVGGAVTSVGNNVKEKRALLADLSPDAQSILAAIGLGSLSPGVGGALTSVGDNV